MMVSDFRIAIREILSEPDSSLLEEALRRFDDMDIAKFSKFLNGRKLPKPANDDTKPDYVSLFHSLLSDPLKFEEEIEKLGKKRSFTKSDLQDLFGQLFDTKYKLPSNITKTEMVKRFKRQRRRDANFASA